jgi:acyl-coenzyme A thioesterase PaaI-like protein
MSVPPDPADRERPAPPPAPPPSGFVMLTGRGGYTTHNGPWYERYDETGRMIRGFRVLPHHLNALGIIHGGLLSAFLDTTMGSAVWQATKRRAVTLRLQLDYLNNTRLNDWVEGTADCTGFDADVAYVTARLYCRRHTLATGQGVFALLSARRKD